MKTIEVLKAARNRISDPNDWCQERFYLKNKRCASAVLRDFSKGKADKPYSDRPAFKALRKAMGHQDITVFNDSHTHAEVLAAFDEAIRRLEVSHESLV